MAMKELLFAVCICLPALNVAHALQGGRYDQQILAATAKILADGSYKNVHAAVDDGIVTLSGTVKLESARTALERKVRHLRNVAGVRNELLLDPPPVEDKTLFGDLSRKLREAGFETIQIKTHNGAVTLIGTVRTPQERNSVIETAWATDGVRVVYPHLSVAY
jgi:osmotically-inducible protein OsmY